MAWVNRQMFKKPTVNKTGKIHRQKTSSRPVRPECRTTRSVSSASVRLSNSAKRPPARKSRPSRKANHGVWRYRVPVPTTLPWPQFPFFHLVTFDFHQMLGNRLFVFSFRRTVHRQGRQMQTKLIDNQLVQLLLGALGLIKRPLIGSLRLIDHALRGIATTLEGRKRRTHCKKNGRQRQMIQPGFFFLFTHRSTKIFRGVSCR